MKKNKEVYGMTVTNVEIQDEFGYVGEYDMVRLDEAVNAITSERKFIEWCYSRAMGEVIGVSDWALYLAGKVNTAYSRIQLEQYEVYKRNNEG